MVKAVGLSLLISGTAMAAPMALSQKDVAELVLKQGVSSKEVTYRYEQSRFDLIKAESATDWKLLLESGYEKDNSVSLNSQVDATYDRYISKASVSKSFLTGTALTFELGRTSQKTGYVSTTIEPELTADIYTLTLEQALWGNLAPGDQALNPAAVRQAEYNYRSTLSLRANELEDVVLEALRQFWNAYVAQENFRQSLAARDRYEKLVAAVRRKTSLGYANPGELSQVQAEFEGQEQSVKKASLDYLKTLDTLLTTLSLPPGTEISFSIPKDLPPVPKLQGKPVEELRAVKSQELKVRAAEEGLKAADKRGQPSLNLVARAIGTGADDTAEGSYSELTGGAHPKYYAGVKFQYNFGSGLIDEDVRAKRAARSLEEVRLQRTRDEERDRAADVERKVGTTYSVAISARRQSEFRERAAQELNRTYTQGRTDIQNLTRALNDLFTSQVTMIRALGDYHIALNEWAAVRDELIPDRKEGEK